MKRLIIAVAVLALFGVTAVAVSASGRAADNARPLGGGSFVDGPYAATSPDSGTCGNAWAIDVYNRMFTIKPQNQDGSWDVVEQFQKARFITLGDGQSGAGQSPGACEPGGNAANVLAEGITGTFKGSFTIHVNPGFAFLGTGGCGTLSDWPANAGNGETPGDCTTASWVAQHFPGAVYGSTATVTTFSLTYKAKTCKSQPTQTWTNADSGNIGDLASC